MRAPFLSIILVVLSGCGLRGDGWDKYASSLTTNQPKPAVVFGTYVLTQQTVTSNGLAVFGGRRCKMDLQADGTFAITNYPTWTNDHLQSFISTTGHWRCDIVGSVYGTQHVWGIRFSDTDPRMDIFSFMGKAAPYGLLMTYSEPDENRVLIFGKQAQ